MFRNHSFSKLRHLRKVPPVLAMSVSGRVSQILYTHFFDRTTFFGLSPKNPLYRLKNPLFRRKTYFFGEKPGFSTEKVGFSVINLDLRRDSLINPLFRRKPQLFNRKTRFITEKPTLSVEKPTFSEKNLLFRRKTYFFK